MHHHFPGYDFSSHKRHYSPGYLAACVKCGCHLSMDW